MNKFSLAIASTLTATSLALTAPSAVAAEDTALDAAATQDSGSSGSSNIGDTLGASPSERGIWGSSKGNNGDDEQATVFGWLWYAYTLAATAAAIGGVVAYNADNIENAAASFGVHIKLPF